MEIYEINTASWLNRLSLHYGYPVTLNNVPPAEWDMIKELNFNAVWLMGVWERSPAAVNINLGDTLFLDELKQFLPDINYQYDLIGSAYSIKNYRADNRFGGNSGLVRARRELNARGLKLLLDFVPNHVAFDHPWIFNHPEYFISGSSDDLNNLPDDFMEVNWRVFAYGRDPNLKPWVDVAQINIFNDSLRQEAAHILKRLALMCDGVRCDMAMLALSRVFAFTWGERAGQTPSNEYWGELISIVKRTTPDFCFLGEAYWDTHAELMSLGFDYCYDKTWLDHLADRDIFGLIQLLVAPLKEQLRLVRFIENHDEKRSASIFDFQALSLAALLMVTTPGAHLYYDGQLNGRRFRTPVQLARDHMEPDDEQIKDYYVKLFALRRRTLPINAFNIIGYSHSSPQTMSWRFSSGSNNYLAAVNFNDHDVKISLRPSDLDNKRTILLFSAAEKGIIDMTTDEDQLEVSLSGLNGGVWLLE
ncbi:alpha-amylase family glycosyl hydrolase [Patescibacteria group bacterium]|nr:alpha-amylase family glycosyl hydrolase [Patescibacteria group bacterium]